MCHDSITSVHINFVLGLP